MRAITPALPCAAFLLGLGLALPAHAEDHPGMEAQSDEALVAVFKAFCLDNFPDEQKMTALAGERGATAMTPEDVKRFLHDDPGHGWFLQTPAVRYTITIELPPYHACAVREMTPSGVNTVAHYKAAIQAFADAQGGTLGPVQQQRMQPKPGLDVMAFNNPLLDTSNHVQENLMLFLSNYHGHPPADEAVYAQQGVGMEVRLIRQMPPEGGSGG